jgi:DNA-binding transcriptional regulator YbjK
MIRKNEIKKDVDLPLDWEIDTLIEEAISFYEKRSITVLEKLYRSALISANATSEYLEMTAELLRERTDKGATVTTLPMIVSAQKTLPDIMKNLKAAEKEVLKERIETEGRMKGSRTMGMYEEGLNYE